MLSRGTRPVYRRVRRLALVATPVILIACPALSLAGPSPTPQDPPAPRSRVGGGSQEAPPSLEINPVLARARQSVFPVLVHDGAGATVATGTGTFIDVGRIVVPSALLERGQSAGVMVRGTERPATAVLAEDRQCGVVLLAVDLPDGAPPSLRSVTASSPRREDGHAVGVDGATWEIALAQAREVPGLGTVQTAESPRPLVSGSAIVNARGELVGIAAAGETAPGEWLSYVVPAPRLLSMRRVGPLTLADWAALAPDTEPAEAKLAYRRGGAAALAGRLDEAAAAYEAAAKVNPGDAGAWRALAECRREQHRIEESIAVWRRAVTAQPSNARFRHELAVDLSDAGRHDEAVAAFAEVVRLRPTDADAHFNLGVALSQVGRYDEEYKSYQAALSLDPTHLRALRNLGVACLTLHRNDEAVASFDRAGRLAPADPEIQTGLGLSYLSLRRYTEAVETLRHVLQIAPAFVKAHFGLGAAYFGLGDRAAARAECQALRAIDKQKGEALCRLVDAK